MVRCHYMMRSKLLSFERQIIEKYGENLYCQKFPKFGNFENNSRKNLNFEAFACFDFFKKIICRHTSYVTDVHTTFRGVMSTPWGPKKSCLWKKHKYWKLKAHRVVSHVFEHAEFDGARKNRFQALSGVVNLISNFWKCIRGKKI